MDRPMQESSDYKFVLGIVAGSVVGACLAMWFTPRGSAFREQLTGAATRVGERASEHLRDASARAGEAVDELARKGREVRDDLAASVARGAHDVERRATAVRTDRGTAL